MAHKRKSKISKVKKSNQLRTKLTKQGKLKKRRHHKLEPEKTNVAPVVYPKPAEDEVSDYEDDIHEMVEEDDVEFLKNAVTNKSYGMLKNLNFNESKDSKGKKRKAEDQDDNEEVENEYENTINQTDVKKRKYLLPIKTSEGLVYRSQEVEDSDAEETVTEEGQAKKDKKEENDLQMIENKTELSTAELLAARKTAIQNKKFRIGILCSGLLENPEAKVKNFKPLLEMLTNSNSELRTTVRKIALVSLSEVFKDVLPSYQIKAHDEHKVKLKKDVKSLHDFENSLLSAYKKYLKAIEKAITVLKRKRGDTRVFKESDIEFAVMALQCLCTLFVTHTYFNFSKNITHLLVPYLNSSKENIRQLVSGAIKEVFKTDKRGDASLEIVRSINKYVRSKNFQVHPDTINVFLSLKLKGVDLDQEKQGEINKKKLQSKKGNILRLSKRERKRGKRLAHIENELLETKAEENVKAKHKHLTDITKLVFMVYFKILKEAPSSKLLNAALEGLAKFAHCINVDFYHDLINVLDQLIEKEGLGYKEQLCCVQTVFTILSHQGATINIDPLRFYTYLYANLFSLHAGRNHSDLPIVLKAAEAVLVKRRKHLSTQRLLAFVKRLTALSQQVLPNGSLGLLSIVRQVLQFGKVADILLEDDASTAQGVYMAEMDEPEYCNANATALWELLTLQRHYHPAVQKSAASIAKMNQHTDGSKSANSSGGGGPEQMFNEFDFSEIVFNPPVSAPRKFKKIIRHGGLANSEFEQLIRQVLSGGVKLSSTLE